MEGVRLTDTHSSLGLCLRSFKCEWDRNEQQGPVRSQVASLTSKPFWSQLNTTFMVGGREGRREGQWRRDEQTEGMRGAHHCKGWWSTKCRVTDRKEKGRLLARQLADRLYLWDLNGLLEKIAIFFSLSFLFCLVFKCKIKEFVEVKKRSFEGLEWLFFF